MKSIAQIESELPHMNAGDMRAEDVREFLARLVEPVAGIETVSLFDALGLVLAADVVSPVSVPPHDNSAMDGFAFDGSQLRTDQPLELTIAGTALAGKAGHASLRPGQCLRIMTGAVMPEGLDTVIPHESAKTSSDGAHITIAPGAVTRGSNRRLRGEDLEEGSPALKRGDRLTPASLGLAASLGMPTLQVRRRLRVAFFSTGDEILSVGDAPREGAIYDSNRYTVFGLLTRLGCELIDLGVVGDDTASLEAALSKAASCADAVITSGGVSGGDADYTRATMKKLGDIAFWQVAMRPGRPMAVGRIAVPGGTDRAVLFGLPGNPVAVMVTFIAFVRPALLQMMGAHAGPQPLLKARAAVAIRKKPGRTEYQRAWVDTAADGSLQVRTAGNQGSGVLRSMVQANGLIVLHHESGDVAQGDLVDVMMFEGAI
ncbi:MAG: molybdopterin molybdotransferase MoeA [Ramlibacter sp.]|nr:molybdopterin molybdotransferase MoeA [Ramlibacter sp.]